MCLAECGAKEGKRFGVGRRIQELAEMGIAVTFQTGSGGGEGEVQSNKTRRPGETGSQARFLKTVVISSPGHEGGQKIRALDDRPFLGSGNSNHSGRVVSLHGRHGSNKQNV